MTLQGLPFTVAAAVGAIAVAAVVFVYTVRWRLPQRRVATTALWLAVTTRRRGGGRLGALDHLISLALHLLIAAALVAAAMQPRLSCQSAPGRAVMLVLDRSSSMAAIERIDSRFDIARRRAVARLEASATGDSIGLVLSGGEPTVARPLGRDPTAIRRAIADASVRVGEGRLEEAVRLACALLADRGAASLVVITDGSEPIGECAGAALEVISVGNPHSNLGIVAFATAGSPRDPRHDEAFIEVANGATVPATAELRLDLDGRLLQLYPLEIKPGERVHRLADNVPRVALGRLVARLTAIHFSDGSADALADDDQAYAVVQRPPGIPIDLVGDDGPLQMVLAANPRYRVAVRPAPAEPRGQVTVISGALPSPLPPGRFLLVDTHGPGSPVELVERVNDPPITFWRDEHPVLRRVVVSDLRVAQATQVRLPASATAIVGNRDVPLVYAMSDGPRRIVGLPFDLASSNLPLRVGFPVLIYNAIDWLTQQAEERSAEASFTVRSTTPVELTVAGGRPTSLAPDADGRVVVAPARPGFYEVSSGGRPIALFAASVRSPGETLLSPRTTTQGPPAPSVSAGRLVDREASPWLLLGALALVLLEWFTYHRRKTV